MLTNLLPKLLLYVSNDQLHAYRWQQGQLTPEARFGSDRDGMEAFGDYLANAGTLAKCRAYLVADLVEEDFQRQLLPHVSGRAGRNLVERRLAQLYRDTPYRHAAIQGRDSAGRHDDHALFSALTNAALLQPWVSALELHQIPLAAIYSAAYLSEKLVRHLAVVQDHLLLISEQTGGLRQTYFEGPHLKFSRLTALAPAEDITAATAGETQRMLQFLNSTRTQGRGEMLHVVVLAPAARMPALELACEDEPEISFHFVDLESAAERFKFDKAPALADPLLLALVGRHAPPTQYDLASAGRFHDIWKARLGLNLATATVATVASLWLLGDVWQIVDASAGRKQLLADAAQMEQRYNAVMATLPPLATKPANMKAAVLVSQLLATQSPAPGRMAAMLSRSLEGAPAIRLTGLDWHVRPLAEPGTVAAPVAGNGSDAIAPLSSSMVGLPVAPAQVLRIDAEVDVALTEYRTILAQMNGFAADLANNAGVTVEIVDAPIDVRQNVKLSGTSGTSGTSADAADARARPKFALKVTWQP